MRRHSAHVDAEVLAELGEGLISGRRAARIRAHLASCERCAGISAGLSAASVLLAAVPSPAMPDAVARRLSGALAAEAAARPGTAVVPARLADREGFHHAERVRGLPSRPRWRGLAGPVAARVFTAAAAVCLLAAGGGYMLARLIPHGAPVPSGPTGPHPLFPSGPQAGPYHPPGQAGMPPGQPGTLPEFTVVKSGTDYQPASLSAQIETELGRVHQARGGETGHAPTTRQHDCVLRVTGGTRPALVDAADYEGHPAMVIALDRTGRQFSQAWVVGPACSAGNSDVITYVKLLSSGG
jgi:hypothetical protein